MASIYEVAVTSIDGKPASLGDYRGKVLLVVNVASKCGLTPQYAGLEALYERFSPLGFEVLGFPCNDFGAQEPGSEAEIGEFCRLQYGVRFPMFAKISVSGAACHPLYRTLIGALPHAVSKTGGEFREKLASYGFAPRNESDVLWNFEKFLISRNGEPIGRFAPDLPPDDALIVGAIETALGAK